MMKKKIGVDFHHWWPIPRPPLEHFRRMFPFLDERYLFVLTDRPDVTLFSCFVNGVCQSVMPDPVGTGMSVFYTGENVRPDMSRCDWAFSFCHDISDPGHMRLPNYVVRMSWQGYHSESLIRRPDEQALSEDFSRRKFCAFIHRHPVSFRDDFVKELSRYKRVDCGGPCMNNIGHHVDDKIAFLAGYKFAMAFENASAPGYTTEKIVDAMLARTVPLYWGDPLVAHDFNPASFLNYADYDHERAFIEKIIELDNDDEAYRAMVLAPYLHDNRVPPVFSQEALEERWRTIFG